MIKRKEIISDKDEHHNVVLKWFAIIAVLSLVALAFSPSVKGAPTVRLTQENARKAKDEVVVAQLFRTEAEVYANAFDVDLDTATQRLNLQSEIGELNALLRDEMPTSFAGMWIEHTPEFKVVAQFTSSGMRMGTVLINGTSLADIVDVRRADKSLDQLESMQLKTIRNFHSNKIRLESAVNTKTNSVEVFVLGKDVTAAQRVVASKLGRTQRDNVEIVTVEQFTSFETDIYGGLEFSGTGPCSTGFAVMHNDGRRGITTAAHCLNDTPRTFMGVQLSREGELRGGNHDVEWHTTDALSFKGKVADNSTDGTRHITGSRGRDAQTDGEVVCKHGKSTGFTCGTILYKTYQPSASGFVFSPTFVRVDSSLPAYPNLSEGGDSGGSWYSGNTALGTHVAGVGTVGTGETQSIYMPINYITDLGLELITYEWPDINNIQMDYDTWGDDGDEGEMTVTWDAYPGATHYIIGTPTYPCYRIVTTNRYFDSEVKAKHLHHFNLSIRARSGSGTPTCYNGETIGGSEDLIEYCDFNDDCPPVITYQVYAAGLDWMDWVHEGLFAGTVGQNRPLEAIRAEIINAPVGMEVCYTVYTANIGWDTETCDGNTAGMIGQSDQIEAVRMRLNNAPADMRICYLVRMEGNEWSDLECDNAIAGTIGQSRQIEGMKITLR